ncbi:MAG: PDZ domain-containing protein, partial [Planctomycetaceae bacterium]|nr:PDZ domain-containing protein [Planctomycetaceae bacterium]
GQWLATTGMGTLPLAVGVMSVQRRAVPRERGLLGISISDAENGAQVTKVHAESGADQAGLKEGDVITSVAGKIVDTGSALANTIRQFSPGDRLELLVMRGTKKLTIRATLSAPFGPLMSRGQVQNLMGGKLSTRRGGFPLAFQHDTVLAPEQCGGPVVNLDGRVVGINLARSGRVESYALPADIALKLIAELKSSSVEKLTATSSATPLPVAAE